MPKPVEPEPDGPGVAAASGHAGPSRGGLRSLERWAFALVPAAALALPLVTRDRTALPASLALGVATGLLLLLALLGDGPPRRLVDPLLAAMLGVVAASAYLEPGLVLGHDTRHHVWGAWAYLQEWHHGTLLPIWLHDLGLGMPQPLFYGPLSFWVMAPVALAGGGTAALVSSSFVAASAAGALSAWLAGAIWSGDRRVALVAATAWSFAPYRLLVSDFRASLGEAWALALTPLVLVAFDRALGRRGVRAFAFAAASLALLVLAHPLSLALLAVVLPVFALARVATIAERLAARVARLARGAGAAVAGLALAGFFVVPLALESRYLHLPGIRGEMGRDRYEGHFVRPGQWLVRQLWDQATWSQHPQHEAKLREMSFYVGLPLLAGLAGGALAGLGRRDAQDPPRLALVAVGVVALALQTRPMTGPGGEVPLLAALQFPWRFLGPASAVSALLAALLVPVGRGRRAALAAGAVALALLVDGFPFSGVVGRVEPWSGLAQLGWNRHATGIVHAPRVPEPWPLRVKGTLLPPPRCCFAVAETWWVFPEYFTPAARSVVDDSVRSSIGLIGYDELRRIDARPYARLWRRGRRAPRPLSFHRAGGRIEISIPEGARGRIEVAEQYFPGWQVEIDGRWHEVTPSAEGFLEAPVPASGGKLHFRFDRWRPDRLAGWILSAATALLLAVACARSPGRDA